MSAISVINAACTILFKEGTVNAAIEFPPNDTKGEGREGVSLVDCRETFPLQAQATNKNGKGPARPLPVGYLPTTPLLLIYVIQSTSSRPEASRPNFNFPPASVS